MEALVVGGAGGIGSRIVERLVRSGYEVTIADVNAESASRVTQETGARNFVAVDIATEAGAQQAVAAATQGGELHVLVNSSGISPKKDGKKQPFFDISLQEWQRVLDINLTGPFLLMKAAYPVLARNDGASIVNIISIIAKTGASGPDGSSFPPFSPSGAHYGASKAALKNLTLSVTRELAPLGIRCNGVSPGMVGTGMGGTIAGDLNEVKVRQIPLGRSATTDEVAAVVSFLVSPEASYLTGEVIDVDGGLYPD